MARLPILEYPDPRLRIRAEPVTKVDADIRGFVEDLLETMYAAPGIGLAATQVNVHKRILVCDVSADRTEPYCLINPEILSSEGTTNSEEGCLSVPEFYDYIDRAAKIKVRALDRDGKPFELEAEGLLAVCIQHEMDHLEGKLFVDYRSDLKRERIRKKLDKDRKERASRSREPSAARAY
jgi:peptide deformylase